MLMMMRRPEFLMMRRPEFNLMMRRPCAALRRPTKGGRSASILLLICFKICKEARPGIDIIINLIMSSLTKISIYCLRWCEYLTVLVAFNV
jgi:hypothetical protein